MIGVNNGYITEIEYPDRFQPELSPSWISATLAALGFKPPSLERGRYCELGCGAGYNLCRLAAANPSMEFVGIDINAKHIDYARRLAEQAKLVNVEFHELDIAGPLPSFGLFDFIVANGMYSWVDQPVRDAILAFGGTFLEPGGVAYIHYMTHPGAATFDTFRNLVRLTVGRADGDLRSGVEEGTALLDRLRRANAGFFVAHPAAGAIVDNMAKEDPHYVAHEYLNSAFTALHVGDVIEAASNEGLSFVGSATPIENIDNLSLPGNVLPILGGITNPSLRETAKDIARNQSLRRDLFLHDGRPLKPPAHLKVLRALRFCALPDAPSAGPVTLQTRIGSVEGPSSLLTPILQRLKQAPATFEEIERTLPDVPTGLVNQALLVLMGAGILHPMVPTCDPHVAERLNVALIARANSGEQIQALAVSEIGSGLRLRPGNGV